MRVNLILPLDPNSISQEAARQPLKSLHFLYHELRPDKAAYSYVVETSEFEKHLDLFRRQRETKGSAIWPELTFDDGHISNFEYALPLLQSREMTARFFITVGWTGNKPGFMGWQQLRELHEAKQQIGAHGWSHTLLTHCSKDQLQTELNRARLVLEDKLGCPIVTMSLPGGRYDRRILAACEDAGYSQVFTSIVRADSLPLGGIVGRLNIRGDVSLEWLEKVLQPESGLLAGLARLDRKKTIVKNILGDRLYEKLWARVNRREADNGTA
jgi:peptidoglycan/xylan/chitin deacetylase (PgdA/CDA1 family)